MRAHFKDCRAGRSLRSAADTAYFVIRPRAARREGTSYHYAPAADFAHADPRLVAAAKESLDGQGPPCRGRRELNDGCAVSGNCRGDRVGAQQGLLAVEMGRLRSILAQASGAKVLCLAHVTNTMGQAGYDFEKGEADGTAAALAVLEAIAARMLRY